VLACDEQAKGTAVKEIRIAHWNVNGRAGKNTGYDLSPLITNEIVGKKSASVPDIVVLTEFVAARNWKNVKSTLEEKQYLVFTSSYEQGKNGVLIALKKNFVTDSTPSGKIKPMENEKPDFLQVKTMFNGIAIAIVGVRVRVRDSSSKDYDAKEDYKERKLQIDALNKHLQEHLQDVENTILVGDFNNSRICGDENKSYKEVKEEYRGLDTYDTYNYHMLKEALSQHTIATPEKGFSWVDKKEFKYKLDHLFTREGMKVLECEYSRDFVISENGYEGLTKENYKSDLSYPDHAILTATLELPER